MTNNPDISGGDNAHKVAAAELRSFCERVERLEEERKTLGDDVKDVMSEAASRGYDRKILKEMLKLRAMDKAEREEREALRQVYGEALGLFPGAFE
jgi:uncharacterized protein (UPF0335 family)